MTEQAQVQQQPVKQEESFFTKNRLWLIILGLALILAILFVSKLVLNISANLLLFLFGMLGFSYFIYWLWKQGKVYSIHKIAKKIREIEYEERGTILDASATNFQGLQLGANTAVHFKKEHLVYFFDPVKSLIAGVVDGDLEYVKQLLKEMTIQKAIQEGKVQPKMEAE